jgi:mono/diheme cytochrome c family protein
MSAAIPTYGPRGHAQILAHALLCILVIAVGGCERGMHDMYEQPRYKPGSPSPLFADGNSARTPPEGSFPITNDASRGPSVITLSQLARGRERYEIFCAPCHAQSGDGHGMVVQRGFPAPASYQSEALLGMPDSHIYDVISHGYGVMYPYADRIAPPDRWAIIAYIRALQLSQHAPRNQLDAEDLSMIKSTDSGR